MHAKALERSVGCMSAVKHRAEGTPEECRERKRRETVADSSVEDGEVEAEVAVAAEPSIQAPASVAAIAGS